MSETFILIIFFINVFGFLIEFAMLDNIFSFRIKVKHIIVGIIFPLATLLLLILIGILFLIIYFSESNVGIKILKFLNKDIINK